MLELRTKFVKANLTSTGLSLQDWKQSLLAYPSFTVLPGPSSKICLGLQSFWMRISSFSCHSTFRPFKVIGSLHCGSTGARRVNELPTARTEPPHPYRNIHGLRCSRLKLKVRGLAEVDFRAFVYIKDSAAACSDSGRAIGFIGKWPGSSDFLAPLWLDRSHDCDRTGCGSDSLRSMSRSSRQSCDVCN